MKPQREDERTFRLWAALHETSHAITRLRDQELRQANANITRIQTAILFTIKTTKDKPATPAEIARRLFREEQTVSMALRQMERKGLVARVRDLQRKNMVRVVLTDKGEEALAQGLTKREVIFDIMSRLTDKEQDDLGELLEKLRSIALKKLGVNRTNRIWLSHVEPKQNGSPNAE